MVFLACSFSHNFHLSLYCIYPARPHQLVLPRPNDVESLLTPPSFNVTASSFTHIAWHMRGRTRNRHDTDTRNLHTYTNHISQRAVDFIPPTTPPKTPKPVSLLETHHVQDPCTHFYNSTRQAVYAAYSIQHTNQIERKKQSTNNQLN